MIGIKREIDITFLSWYSNSMVKGKRLLWYVKISFLPKLWKTQNWWNKVATKGFKNCVTGGFKKLFTFSHLWRWLTRGCHKIMTVKFPRGKIVDCEIENLFTTNTLLNTFLHHHYSPLTFPSLWKLFISIAKKSK